MHRSEGDLLNLLNLLVHESFIEIPGNVNGMLMKLAYTLDQKTWCMPPKLFPISTNVACI